MDASLETLRVLDELSKPTPSTVGVEIYRAALRIGAEVDALEELIVGTSGLVVRDDCDMVLNVLLEGIHMLKVIGMENNREALGLALAAEGA